MNDKYYQVVNFTIMEWKFFCEHPNNNEYVIMINTWTENPKKFYKNELNNMFHTNELAEKELISQLKSYTDFLQMKYG